MSLRKVRLGNVTYLLDVTPSNSLSQHYDLLHFLVVSVAEQHPIKIIGVSCSLSIQIAVNCKCYTRWAATRLTRAFELACWLQIKQQLSRF